MEQLQFTDLPPIESTPLPATHQLGYTEPSEHTPHHFQELHSTQQCTVQEKLMQNKLRKFEIDFHLEQEKEFLVQKRRKKEKEILQLSLKRYDNAKEQREENLRMNCLQKKQNRHEASLKHLDRQVKLQARQASIDLCRKRVENKRNEYIIRIQSKTRERQEKAQLRRQIMVNISDQFTDEIHLDEWKQYETKLLKKHEGNAFQPDRLYQEYKKKNLLMQTMMRMRQQTKEMTKENVETPITTIPLSHPHPHHRLSQEMSHAVSSGHILLKSNKKVEYFGVHEEDMMKQTLKDIPKMRKYIEQHTSTFDPSQDEELVDRFQAFLLKTILK